MRCGPRRVGERGHISAFEEVEEEEEEEEEEEYDAHITQGARALHIHKVCAVRVQIKFHDSS